MTRPYTVLIADDDLGERDLMVGRLAEGVCEVALPDDATAALALVEAGAVDLVMVGVDTGASLRAVAVAAAALGIPVVGISTAAALDVAADGLADDYLLRPVHPGLVAARIEAYRRLKHVCEEVTDHQGQIGVLKRRFEAMVKAVVPIGVALLGARDFEAMLERILLEAKALCDADGGTLYLRTEDDHLRFVIMRNDSLAIVLGGTSGAEIPFPPLPLYDPQTGAPNDRNVATWAALSGESINIADAYHAEGFEFSGTIAFDQRTGYRSTSFLTVPLKSASGAVIGVLQLLNAIDAGTGAVVPFDPSYVPLVESLSTLAAAALEVYLREERLRSQIRELHIQIDEVKRARQVAEITDSDYFQTLQRKARQLRERP